MESNQNAEFGIVPAIHRWASVALFVITMFGSSVFAQGIDGRASRSKPSPNQQRLSPYLDLLRSDNSVLGPYHSFVRPRQQFRQAQNSQAKQIKRLETSLYRSNSITPQPGRMQTGRGGEFNEYLHFYQFKQPGQR